MKFYTVDEIEVATKILDLKYVDQFYAIECNFECNKCTISDVCTEKQYLKLFNKIKREQGQN